MLSDQESRRSILRNRKFFEKLLAAVEAETVLEKQFRLAKKAVTFAVNHSTGYYSSAIIERALVNYAHALPAPSLPEAYQKDTFLHVMTECYETGGHTRVVERWIEFSPDHEKHSLFLTEKEHQVIPQRLNKALQDKGGDSIKMPDTMTEVQKALALRTLASRYEFIILHIHMHDIVPLLAFGTEKFKRPVIFFNHADHRFWVGIGIADMIAELRTWGQNLTREKRGGINTHILGIPTDSRILKDNNKTALRTKLGLPQDKKILLTLGSAYKYKPMGGMNFFAFIEKVLTTHRDAIFIIIGFKEKAFSQLKKLSQKMQGRIFALGVQPPSVCYEYAGAADCALDSFPMSGGTALGDMTSAGCPVLALQCPAGQLDYIFETDAYCTTEAQLLEKIACILENEGEASNNVTAVSLRMLEYNGKEQWLQKLKELYESVAAKHKITMFHPRVNAVPSELDVFLYLSTKKKKSFLKNFLYRWRLVK
jgi:hypothetical protein